MNYLLSRLNWHLKIRLCASSSRSHQLATHHQWTRFKFHYSILLKAIIDLLCLQLFSPRFRPGRDESKTNFRLVANFFLLLNCWRPRAGFSLWEAWAQWRIWDFTKGLAIELQGFKNWGVWWETPCWREAWGPGPPGPPKSGPVKTWLWQVEPQTRKLSICRK